VAPIIALILAFAGVICLLASAVVGVSTTGDYILSGAEACLAIAAVLLIGYVALGVLSDARALKSE
jgi:hypothetical protein